MQFHSIRVKRGLSMKKMSYATLILLFLLSAGVLAQSSDGEFTITKSTIDSGGGTSSAGEYALTGTIGQPDASKKIATGDGFTLSGGFWANATIIDLIFKDSFETD